MKLSLVIFNRLYSTKSVTKESNLKRCKEFYEISAYIKLYRKLHSEIPETKTKLKATNPYNKERKHF